MKCNLYFIQNRNGRQFAVKLLQKGDSYGLDKCLTWDSSQTGIEFYDVTYAGDGFDEVGQFVSRYYISSILEHSGTLCLNGDVSEWSIDGDNMQKIIIWIKSKNIIE